ncbi:phage antirepressor KilAC domain-containing protein [Lactococcus lactis]|uniref:phage antirepressor KilAC domain-containing protein n=1 Tax=Lactococcus lactis TaxID=1358 RepID=UPI00288EBF8A|nr:phage antirepressor KilAC domain-containing protein [Lactococcus lactis]MDT2917575.1 phage antirepressor KilAC domain-containing protein [Lactococcus lactis]MDT2939246.1 phage antirepressor KilAC domain-containing protein [Lactococcus lactis]
MKELQNFTNGIFNLDVKVEGENILFNVKDVARALGFEKVETKNGRRYHSIRWSTITKYLRQEVGEKDFISEPMVYKLAFKANNAVSEKFTDWLAVEVLPTIRKHGAYMTDSKLEEALLNPDTLINLATQLKQEREEKAQLRALNSTLAVENQIMQPKAQYFDDLVERNLLTSFRDTAKMLKVGQKQLIDWLLENKYIYRDKKNKLMPYAQYNNDLFEIKESKGATSSWKGAQTLITPVGRETFNLLLNEYKAS